MEKYKYTSFNPFYVAMPLSTHIYSTMLSVTT